MRQHSRTWSRRAPALALVLILATTVWACSGGGGRRRVPLDGQGLGGLTISMARTGSAESCASILRKAGYGELRSLTFVFDSILAAPVCPESTTCPPIEALKVPITLNLMDIGDSMTIELGNADLPVGDYTGLTLHIAEATIVTDSTEIEGTPCEGANPIVVTTPFTILEDQMTIVTVLVNQDQLISPNGKGNSLLCPDLKGNDDGSSGNDDGSGKSGKSGGSGKDDDKSGKSGKSGGSAKNDDGSKKGDGKSKTKDGDSGKSKTK